MNRVECAKLLAFIAELDYRKFTEATVEAWFEVLGRHELAEAKSAVIAHYDSSEPEFLKPNHITSQIRAARRGRLNAVTRVEVADVDDSRGPGATARDFEAYRAVRQDVKNAIGSGRVSREQYQSYLAGRTPWREFLAGLRNTALES